MERRIPIIGVSAQASVRQDVFISSMTNSVKFLSSPKPLLLQLGGELGIGDRYNNVLLRHTCMSNF